jgi:hypothetical protein
MRAVAASRPRLFPSLCCNGNSPPAGRMVDSAYSRGCHEEAGNCYRRHRIDRNARLGSRYGGQGSAVTTPAPVYNWTGFYVGGNIGASFGRAKTDFNAAPVAVTTVAAGTSIPGPTLIIPGFVGSELTEPAGAIGGGQIGYN